MGSSMWTPRSRCVSELKLLFGDHRLNYDITLLWKPLVSSPTFLKRTPSLYIFTLVPHLTLSVEDCTEGHWIGREETVNTRRGELPLNLGHWTKIVCPIPFTQPHNEGTTPIFSDTEERKIMDDWMTMRKNERSNETTTFDDTTL